MQETIQTGVGDGRCTGTISDAPDKECDAKRAA
jgi:hypothetical protein